MTKEPLVSILLPTFNRAHLLPRAIASVLDQTYQNWELLIWNDGSTDDTEQVLQALTDPRIRTFNDINHGKPYALNQAYANAHGDLIAFLDDDDEWLPDKLGIQIMFLQENPDVDLCFGNFRNIDKATSQETLGFMQSCAGIKKLVTITTSHEFKLISDGWLEGIGTDNFIATDTVILRKVFFDRVGLFNEGLQNSEDFEFWWRAGLAGVRAAYTDEILLIRNKYPGSLSSTGIFTLTNTLRALDACKEASHRAGREETVHFLRPAYGNLWQNLIKAYGQVGDISSAFRAFISAAQYEVNPGSFRLILGAFLHSLGQRLK